MGYPFLLSIAQKEGRRLALILPTIITAPMYHILVGKQMVKENPVEQSEDISY
jgi:hypothetical protein